jgi:hypothetical protein
MTDASTSPSHTVVTGRSGPGGSRPDATPDTGPDASGRSAYDVTGRIAVAVVAGAWAVILLLMMSRRVFISHDSLSNNVHVWYLADQLWSGHGIPLHMPVLASGKALTFPYASLPWITASLLWPVLGDRVVTLWLVLGFLGTVAATFWTFPTLRRGWWAAATLTNPALVISPLLGQLPFLWAVACFTFAMGLWKRGRTFAAVALTTIASIIHPAVLMPIIAIVVVVWLPFEAKERRRPLVGWWLLTVALTLPAVWAVFQSPVVSQTTFAAQISAEFQTVGMRLLVIGVPMLLVAAQRYWKPPRWAPVACTVAFVVLQVPMYQPFGMDFAWGSLRRNPDPSIDAFADSDGVTPGHVYRVLTGGDGKYGLYAVVQAGGVLDAEFFPEGLHRGPFASVQSYSRFLRKRDVDSVVVFPTYTERYTRSNEPELLGEMEREGCIDGLSVTRRPGGNDWQVYDVERGC